MVRDVDGWSNAQDPCVSVIEQRKEHFFVELFRIGQSDPLEKVDDVVVSDVVLDVKLWRHPFHVCSVGAGRSGYHSPPLISRLAVDERDEPPAVLLMVDLFFSRVSG